MNPSQTPVTSQAALRDLCVPDLVHAQAQENPDAIAVATSDGELTYRELDGRANQLACCLNSLGIGRDVPVGLYLKRSLELVVGALGILKAGGAYVPLDPSNPPNRLVTMLNDVQPPVVVTTQDMAERLPSGKWRLVRLDADEFRNDRYPENPPLSKVEASHLAYIIYTSGSTGRPKGVRITHDSLLNLVFWHRSTFKTTCADRASQQASPGFDAAVWELWPYLAAGASVHVIDEAIHNAPELLRDWLVAKGITVSFLPTALAEYMMDLQWPPETALRVLLTGADTLRHYPPANLPFVLVNNYGPTECTVVATSGTVPTVAGPAPLPTIGRPIANTQVYILDEHLNQVPTGTPGELHIGGSGVADGYLNLPELTAEKFIPDPFGRNPLARLYKTGDLARYLPNGELVFLGRIDEQIKIRGYRIEPQEVTAILDCHPAVKASLVSTSEDALGIRRLVAYVVPASNLPPTAADLRDFLSARLPDYMVPSTFVRVERFPITAHGKVDRTALPAATAENTLREESFQAASSVVEERLTDILRILLGVKRIGVDDNFFHLGGHSLLAAQLIARVRDSFGVELSLLVLFDNPTVRGMASEIESLIRAKLEAMSEDELRSILASSEAGATS